MKERKELGELLPYQPVSLMIKKNGLRWFGHVESKDDNSDCVKHCMILALEEISLRQTPKDDLLGRHRKFRPVMKGCAV